MHRPTLTVIPLVLLVFVGTSAQDIPITARKLFAAARIELSHESDAANRAESFAYLAQREDDAGFDSQMVWQQAFQEALKLPQSRIGLKAEVEADAVDAAVEHALWPATEAMAKQADAGRVSILNRLIPAEIAASRIQQAWTLWKDEITTHEAVPYRAAVALSNSSPDPATAQVLRRHALAGLTQVHDVASAEDALDFLKTVPASEAPSAALSALPLRVAVGRMSGANWERDQFAQDLDSWLRRVAPNLPPPSATPDSMPPRPELSRRTPAAPLRAPNKDSRPTPVAIAGRLPEADLLAQGSYIWAAIRENDEAAREAQHALNSQRGTRDPVSVVSLALAFYEAGKQKQWPPLVTEALDLAAALAQTDPAMPHPISASHAIQVFGLAAEIAPEQAAARAMALPPSTLKPLLLAHIARVMVASQEFRPGHPLYIVH